MRVESADVFPIKMRTKRRLVAGPFSYPEYRTVLVRLKCDGEVGWGEAMTRFSPKATAYLIKDDFFPLLRKMDFDSPGDAWHSLWDGLRTRGHTRGVSVEALSALEIALWDCYGKLQGRPIGALLAEGGRDEVSCYGGSLFQSRGSLEKQVEEVKSLGINGIKVKVGFGIERDTQILESVRRIWDGSLIADANGAYEKNMAFSAVKKLSRFDLEWFEEPVPADDLEGYRRLAELEYTPLGAGETWFVEDFKKPIGEGLVDVILPSVSRCGGIKVAWDVSQLASRHRIQFSPMVGLNSAISLAAALQIASISENLAGIEYNPFGNPLVEGLAPGFPQLRAGKIAVPKGDGLGIDINFPFIKCNMLD